MKIVFDNGGQTCNKFWSYIPILSECIGKDEKAYFLSHIPELEYYPVLKNNAYLKFPFYNRRLNKRFGKRYSLLFNKFFRNSVWDIVPPLCRMSGNLLIDPWDSVNKGTEAENMDEIKKYFVPDESVRRQVENEFSGYKDSNSIIVGVHIRRGDYREWMNGRYFYEFDGYADCCRSLLEGGYFKRPVVFFLCSNEKICFDSFEGISIFQLSANTSVHDLYALSICDYIIGPPSTFSAWASFMGNKPYAAICDVKNFIPDFNVVRYITDIIH